VSEDINLSVQKKKLADFDLRLHNARNANNGSTNSGNVRPPDDGKSKAIRISTELIVAVTVGGGIGLLLDNWLETKPWFLLVFLLLGNAAGLWNVFRLTNGHRYKIGFEDNKTPSS
jgi:ATP synthase protein I